MKFLKKIWDAVTEPFLSVAVLIDESKRIDDDRSTWAKYNRKRNEKMMRKAKRKEMKKK